MREITIEKLKDKINELKKEIANFDDSPNLSSKEKENLNHLIKALDQRYFIIDYLMDNNYSKKDKKEPVLVKTNIIKNIDGDREVLIFMNDKFYLEDQETYFKNADFKTTITKEQIEKDMEYYKNRSDNCGYIEGIDFHNRLMNLSLFLYKMAIYEKDFFNSDNSFLILTNDCNLISNSSVGFKNIVCINKISQLYLRTVNLVETDKNNILFIQTSTGTDYKVIEKSDNTTKKEIDKKINEFLLSYEFKA